MVYIIYKRQNRKARESVSSIMLVSVQGEKTGRPHGAMENSCSACVPTIVNGHNCGLHMHAGCTAARTDCSIFNG